MSASMKFRAGPRTGGGSGVGAEQHVPAPLAVRVLLPVGRQDHAARVGLHRALQPVSGHEPIQHADRPLELHQAQHAAAYLWQPGIAARHPI